MQTRSSSRLTRDQTSNPTSSTNTTPKDRNRKSSKQKVENSNLEEHLPPIVTMVNNRTMAELLRAPTEGYAEAIVGPLILAEQFELKHNLINMMTTDQFFRLEKDNLHDHIRCLQNEILNFQQRFDESFHEAWDRYKDLLHACPHRGFTELHQLDTFYNALNPADQDSLNVAAGGNLLERSTQDVLTIIKNKSKVRNSRSKPIASQVKACDTNSNSVIAKLTHAVNQQMSAVTTAMTAVLKQFQATPTPALVKAVEETYVTCGGAHPYYQCLAVGGKTFLEFRDNIQGYVSTAAVNYNQENEPEATKDTVIPTNNRNTEDVQPHAVQSKPVTSEPANTPVSASKPNPQASIPYPSRRNDERSREKAKDQIEKFYQIFNDMSFEISFADALILMPKFASTLKALIGNKEKLSEMARTSLNEHCSAKLSLPNLTPTCMTLELADRSISRPVGVAEDVYVKLGSFYFPTDFVIVDFDADPRVPLVLERSFLKTERALIDVFKGELTLRVGKEAITYNLDQTSRYSANYNDMTAKRIDVIDMACEEYSQEVLGFSYTISSGNSTLCYDPIISVTSPTLTSFGKSDFLLEEVDAFLAVEDEPTSSQFPQSYLDPEGDILLLEAFLNDDPSSPPPNKRNYMPEVRNKLKICEAKTDKSSIDEPPAVKLKVLPPHLEYAFLEGEDKLLVIIAKDLSVEEKAALIMVLKSHKRAIAWKLSDIKGINPEFCTHKILMEDDFTPTVQHQRRVNPKIHDVIKQEVIKLLDTGLIYPISDSPWVSPVHCDNLIISITNRS
uniref:Reverse transcriptase domain-containing protein n=1 Tax=Tanacetum cinerariifolium TaxID=118510 RepID=A0A6L2JR25_TANCI|nr:reverse transcriptase domain-containing protein [Tanacetum cinerariifolium]